MKNWRLLRALPGRHFARFSRHWLESLANIYLDILSKIVVILRHGEIGSMPRLRLLASFS